MEFRLGKIQWHSVDHLEIMKPEDIEALKNTETMPVALPSCSYFLVFLILQHEK
jgi:hypothetical protein